ncbi:MAG: GDSL-type esterase/lipase family protein [Pirellulales bacterium]
MLAPHAQAKDGPTPYPDAKDEQAWPGKGPIRMFGWMVDHRNAFWKRRDADRGAVVFAGDSLTENWKAKPLGEAFPDWKLANRGIGGDTSRGLLFRFEEDVLDLEPRALVLCIGSNDLSAHGDPAGIAANIQTMLAAARKRFPELPIVLCTVPPRAHPQAPAKPGAHADLNARIKKLPADDKRIAVVDLVPVLGEDEGKPTKENFGEDRLHLAAPGYEKWGAALKPAFEKLGLHRDSPQP